MRRPRTSLPPNRLFHSLEDLLFRPDYRIKPWSPLRVDRFTFAMSALGPLSTGSRPNRGRVSTSVSGGHKRTFRLLPGGL